MMGEVSWGLPLIEQMENIVNRKHILQTSHPVINKSQILFFWNTVVDFNFDINREREFYAECNYIGLLPQGYCVRNTVILINL